MKSLSKLNVIVILPTDNDKTLTAQTKATNEQLDYSYNSGGIRTGKTYSTPTNVQNVHEYTLDDTNIIRETIDQYYDNNTLLSSAELYYYYDESGIAGFEYNGTTYYFLKNIQGDVINILNASGQVVVTYTYDAWGNVVSVTGSLANTVGQINPFRYRGYYYDTETGFYYLQTRYYDPQVGRFLNADSIIGANGGIIGFNLFAYCGNNPIPNVDFNGNQFSRWQDYELGSMESTILFYWECYYFWQDNFGFTGDIDFDKLPLTKRQNGIDAFISAMEKVNFQAPPALIER